MHNYKCLTGKLTAWYSALIRLQESLSQIHCELGNKFLLFTCRCEGNDLTILIMLQRNPINRGPNNQKCNFISTHKFPHQNVEDDNIRTFYFGCYYESFRLGTPDKIRECSSKAAALATSYYGVNASNVGARALWSQGRRKINVYIKIPDEHTLHLS